MPFPSAPNQDFFYEVSAGRVPGFTAKLVDGFTKSENTIGQRITIGGVENSFPLAAETQSMVSDSALDNASGTGMRVVKIIGLDENFVERTERVTLDGITPVISNQAFLRVLEIRGVSCGSLGGNVGTITLSGTSTLNVASVMRPLDSRSRSGVYTVPANKRSRVVLFGLNTSTEQGGKSGLMRITGLTREFPGANSPWINIFETSLDSTGGEEYNLDNPLGSLLLPKTDLRVQYETPIAGVEVHVRLYILEEVIE